MTERDLRQENATLRAIVGELHWQARRYCDGRATYVTSDFNRMTRALLALGVPLNRTGDETLWARDAMGRVFDGLTDQEAAEGRPLDAATVRAWRDEEWETERARAREHLDAVDQAIKRLAHDLRGGLAGVVALADMLERDLAAGETARATARVGRLLALLRERRAQLDAAERAALPT